MIENMVQEALDDSVKRNMTFFAKSTFIDRYPDVRDGFKPVARRILYVMKTLGLGSHGNTIKCAKIVGDVMGAYHPHGDSSIYGTLVGMAQPFGENYPEVSGQGNFGNPLGDPAAAYRYTEAQFSDYAVQMLVKDLNDEIVEFVPNFDNKTTEPSVLPASIPNILINGNYTIGGAAFNSSIPSHNLNDVCKLVIDYIKNPKMTNAEMGKRLIPDFPCGGVITNPAEVREYYTHNTQASIKMRGCFDIDEAHNCIHITELPWLVDGNTLKNEILKKFPKLRSVGIDMVTTDCEENTKTGDFKMSVTITYIKGTDPYKLMDLIASKTKFKSSAQLIFTCVIGGRLMVDCTIKDMLDEWLKFRRETVRKRLTRQIKEIYRETHVLEAILKVYGPELKKIFNYASDKGVDKQDVINWLMSNYGFSVLQATDIASMRMYEVTKRSKEELIARYNMLMGKMTELRALLNDSAIDQMIIADQQEAMKRFGRPRRTKVDGNAQEAIGTIEAPGIDLTLVLSNDNSVSVVRTEFLKMGVTIRGLPKTEGTRRQIMKYNTKDDILMIISNFGFIYRYDDVKSAIEMQTVASPKWLNLTAQFPRIGEKIAGLLPVNASDFENGIGDLVVLRPNGYMKRSGINVLPSRFVAKGTRVSTSPYEDGAQMVVRHIKPKDGEIIMQCDDNSKYHMYPLKDIVKHGRTAVGIKMHDADGIAIDIFEVNPKSDELVYFVCNDGHFGMKALKDIAPVKRNVSPKPMASKGRRDKPGVKCVGVGMITPRGTLVTTSDGVAKVYDLTSPQVISLPVGADGAFSL